MKTPGLLSKLWNGIDWVRTTGSPREAGRRHGEHQSHRLPVGSGPHAGDVCPQKDSPHWGPMWGRFLSMCRLIEAAGEPGIERLQSMLRDHHKALPEYPKSSVCNKATAAALIGVPRHRRLYIAGSPPCRHPFREVRFSDREACPVSVQ